MTDGARGKGLAEGLYLLSPLMVMGDTCREGMGVGTAAPKVDEVVFVVKDVDVDDERGPKLIGATT